MTRVNKRTIVVEGINDGNVLKQKNDHHRRNQQWKRVKNGIRSKAKELMTKHCARNRTKTCWNNIRSKKGDRWQQHGKIPSNNDALGWVKRAGCNSRIQWQVVLRHAVACGKSQWRRRLEKERVKFPLRDEPSNLDSTRATMKEGSARAGDSIEGGPSDH